METISKKDFAQFCNTVNKARQLKGLKTLDRYVLHQYCETLINGANMMQLACSADCSTRFDLVFDSDKGEESFNTAPWKKFCREYLGLDLVTQGDPRGAVFKLVVGESLGDSWGDRTHLCVPAVDAFQCLA